MIRTHYFATWALAQIGWGGRIIRPCGPHPSGRPSGVILPLLTHPLGPFPGNEPLQPQKYGWGGRIRTSVWRDQNPLPYRLATPQLEIYDQPPRKADSQPIAILSSKG